MLRIWALAVAYIGSLLTLLMLGPLGGAETLLTAGVPIGAGIAVATLGGGGFIIRAVWLFVGVLMSALGYVAGASLMPDTTVGLVIGGAIPILLIALFTMWTRRQAHFVAGMLGAGALAGVFAYRFNLDPQALNVALPIAIGQTVLPMAIGYIAGMLAGLTRTDDKFFDDRAAKKSQPPEPEPDNVEEATPTTAPVEV
jgi:hypothetical protein